MWSRKAFNRLFFSFPIQLVVVLLKKNHILLLYWVILFGWITNSTSKTFGIPFLFLDPEYMGTVGFTSFFIMGFATGSFVMVYNISSYIVNGFRFPFIATLGRPFLKYTINNFIVPSLFVLTYLGNIFYFQLNNEYQSIWTVLVHLLGFITGMTLIIMVTLTYFFHSNKDIVHMFGVETSDADPNAPVAEHLLEMKEFKPKRKLFSARKKTYDKVWRVDTYLSTFSKVKLVRQTGHYTREMVESVFRQNHLNAAIVEIIVFGLFIIMGLFKDYSFFQIPAGASVLLIFSMFIMLSSAFRFWLKAWAGSVFILLIIVINALSRLGIFYPDNKAYGMEYTKNHATYSISRFNSLDDAITVQADYDSTLKILERWKEKFITDREKPKMIFVNCSGGGLRASIWAFRIMQVSDSLTNNEFSKSTQLITGASGGMIGAAYYRELLLQQRLGLLKKFNSKKSISNIGKDLLNPVAYSVTVSDLFFNIQKFQDGNTRFSKDRAYAFEKQLNENTGSVLNKRLTSYRQPEATGLIPMMVFSPTIVNDGRRLMISPQPISYLASHVKDSSFQFEPTIDEIEFRQLFREQAADNIKFTSVLRMNATFPYILPAVTLPSHPQIQVMDAGIRDNTGLKTSLKFLYVFRKWIEENTSGVIFVDVRDSHKARPIEEKPRMTFLENIITPLGNIYGNLLTIQDYNQDEAYEYAKSWFHAPFDFVIFELPTKEQDISLSWHLTTREKRLVENSVNLKDNLSAMDKLLGLLSRENKMNATPLLVEHADSTMESSENQ
ncbi:MAG: patatin-like phospholipase family protein [Bacteroidetes bacterium]|nr:patatin-like phospholipase family protein [Bacteroidota bacterium]MBL0139638.1 patatin-like phospholipase family protein [Bacteroidota bacterium]